MGNPSLRCRRQMRCNLSSVQGQITSLLFLDAILVQQTHTQKTTFPNTGERDEQLLHSPDPPVDVTNFITQNIHVGFGPFSYFLKVF